MRMFLLAALAALAACQPSSSAPPDNLRADDKSGEVKAPLGAMVDPASPGSATEVASRYASAVSNGRLGEAFGLLAPGSEAAGNGAASFANHFRDRRDVAMHIGKAGDTIDSAQLKLVEVPAVISGVDKTGTSFRVEGPILLRVSDKSATPDLAPTWQIVRTPFPA